MKSKGAVKLNRYIMIIIIAYLILCGGIILFSFKYVEKKREKLHDEARSELRKFFEKQKEYVMIDYSGKKVAYEEGEIPTFKPSPLLSTFLSVSAQKEDWEESYGNLYKVYNLKPKWTTDNELDKDRRWTGWRFHMIRADIRRGGFYEYYIYPYSVGYFKQTDSWMYNYTPSVQTAINESFNFYTTNPQSSYYGKITESYITPFDIKCRVENDYFVMFSADELVEVFGEQRADSILDFSPWEGNVRFGKIKGYEMDEGAMYNGYYRVEIKRETIAGWSITYDIWNDPQTKDRNLIIICGLSILSLLFTAALTLLILRKKKVVRIEKETTKQRLLRLCHPNNFMKPFDKEKVDKANGLYSKIVEVSEGDIETLKTYINEASQELGISFVDNYVLESLKKKCNPKNYMKPYNANKVALATELFDILNKQNITFDEVCMVEEKSKAL